MKTHGRRRRRWFLALGLPVLLVVGYAAWAYWPAQRAAPVAGNGPVRSADAPWALTVDGGSERPGGPPGKTCVGTLVAPRAVVTAAHCIAGRTPDQVRVGVGRTDLRGREGRTVAVSDIWTVPGYPDGLPGFFDGVLARPGSPPDIGVLLLKNPVPERPLPMATTSQAHPAAGTSARVTGWRVSPQDEPLLWQTPTTLLDDTRCVRAAADATKGVPPVWHGFRYPTDAYLCAGAGRSTFRIRASDSGAPLITGGRLIGVANWTPDDDPAAPMYYARGGTYSDHITRLIAAAGTSGTFPH